MATWLFLGSLAGLLVVFRLWLEGREGFAGGCMGFRRTERVDCAAVVTSPAGKFLGISNVVWGGLFYATLALLNLVRIYGPPAWDGPLSTVSALLVTWGFGYTAYLVWYQHHVLRKYCPLCMTSALVVLFLTVGTVLDLLKGGEPPYYPSLALWGVLAAGALVIWQLVDALVAREEGGCRRAPAPLPEWTSLLDPEDPSWGPEESPVHVVEILDPNCPHCRAFHPVMKQLLAAYRDRVRFTIKPVPLWPYSVLQIEALYLAHEQGRFLDMLEAQFARQKKGGLSEEELVALARTLGLDMEAFLEGLRARKYRARVEAALQNALRVGIEGVPTVLINGHPVPHTAASMNLHCLRRLIQEALQEELQQTPFHTSALPVQG